MTQSDQREGRGSGSEEAQLTSLGGVGGMGPSARNN